MTGLLAAAPPVVTSTWFTALVALIVGAGGTGGVAAFLKIRPERGRIVIDAAQGAVIVQSGVLADLRAELDRVRGQVEQLRADRDVEIGRLRAEHEAEMAAQRERYEATVARLRAEIGAVSTRVTRVEDATGTDPGTGWQG